MRYIPRLLLKELLRITEEETTDYIFYFIHFKKNTFKFVGKTEKYYIKISIINGPLTIVRDFHATEAYRMNDIFKFTEIKNGIYITFKALPTCEYTEVWFGLLNYHELIEILQTTRNTNKAFKVPAKIDQDVPIKEDDCVPTKYQKINDKETPV